MTLPLFLKPLGRSRWLYMPVFDCPNVPTRFQRSFLTTLVHGKKKVSQKLRDDEPSSSTLAQLMDNDQEDVSHLQSIRAGSPNNIGDIDNVLMAASHSQEKDLFAWAVIYENQRGMYLFQTPLYSRFSLFPGLDPAPYTLPSSFIPHGTVEEPAKSRFRQVLRRLRRDHPTPTSKAEYPLPDGTWRFVSSNWMLDMQQADVGRLQHDGFEYNWIFRERNWSSIVGFTGWVRRRRWIRLMVRPAISRRKHLEDDARFTTENDTDDSDSAGLWKGDPSSDWERCQRILGDRGRDGKKLELWRNWFSEVNNHSRIVAVLQTHVEEVLHSFVYPDSRAQFLQMLSQHSILQHIDIPLGIGPVSFWSRVQTVEAVKPTTT